MDVYIGTIQPFAFQFAPRGWMLCSGQLLAIRTYSALFSLIGTTYGGDGINTFALPNLNGRTVLGQGVSTTGTDYQMGEAAGTERVTLMQTQMPQHTHALMASTAAATSATPDTGLILATANGSDQVSGDPVNVQIYGPGPASSALAPNAVGIAGGNQPFYILQPYLVINYSIAISGIFPSRN